MPVSDQQRAHTLFTDLVFPADGFFLPPRLTLFHALTGESPHLPIGFYRAQVRKNKCFTTIGELKHPDGPDRPWPDS